MPAGQPGAGSSVLLVQLWEHDADAWEGLADQQQERVIGRTKPDSVELDEATMPPDSHVARTSVDAHGQDLEIFRRNTATGTLSAHGTAFVGFSAEQERLAEMLRRMAGLGDGDPRRADPLHPPGHRGLLHRALRRRPVPLRPRPR